MRIIITNFKICFIFIIFLVGISLFAEKVSQSQHKTSLIPLFASTDPKSPVVGILHPEKKYSIIKVKKNVFLKNPASIAHSSGVHYFQDCYLITQNGKSGWIIDGITAEDNELSADFQINSKLLPFTYTAFAITYILLLIIIIRLLLMRLKIRSFLQSNVNILLLVAFMLIMRISFILRGLFTAGMFVIAPSDESGYYGVGESIFKTFDFSQCKYTIGFGIYHGIFAFLCDAKSYIDVLLPISYFNTIIIGSGIGILIYLITVKIFNSKRIALITLFIYSIIPFIIQVNHSGGIHTWDFFGFPKGIEYTLLLYYWAAWVGFTPLSDTVNMGVIMTILLLALIWTNKQSSDIQKKPQLIYSLIIGLLFGFSGTIRVVNIYFLLFFVYIILKNHLTFDKNDRKPALLILTMFFIGSFIGFSPQILANYLQDGNVFTLPYHIFHSKLVAKGFEIGCLSIAGPMIFNSSSIILSTALPGVFMIKEHSKRLLFVLYILPLLIFYCGYLSVSACTVRFALLLYPMLYMLIAITCRNAFPGVVSALFFIFIFKSSYFLPENQGIEYIYQLLGAVIIALTVLCFYRNKFLILNIAVFSLILFSQTVITLSAFNGWKQLYFIYIILFASSIFFTVLRDKPIVRAFLQFFGGSKRYVLGGVDKHKTG